ncbi:MAG TPA: hypothetical protein VK459_24140 [Polyangiaceae bacterium]|nr:hypothetical protein [Polyangiaceae bacterium]
MEKQIEGFSAVVDGMRFYIPRSAVGLELMSASDDGMIKNTIVKEEYVTFDLSPNEQLYAAWIACDIEATFGRQESPASCGIAR